MSCFLLKNNVNYLKIYQLLFLINQNQFQKQYSSVFSKYFIIFSFLKKLYILSLYIFILQLVIHLFCNNLIGIIWLINLTPRIFVSDLYKLI